MDNEQICWQDPRLSQSRSHGFLVWCGRTWHEAFARSLARASRSALGARTIALRAHCRATRSKARLVSKSSQTLDDHFASYENIAWI